MNSAVWQPFIEQLPDNIEPVCIDLPGHGEFNQRSFSGLQDLTDHLLQQTQHLSGPRIWVGWSLGALPLLQLASDHADKVSELLILASNPKFVADDDWSQGVEETVFDLFADNLQSNIEKTLQRFLSLQVQGMKESREVLRQLRQLIVNRGLPSADALTAGLEVLKNTDARAQLAELKSPVRWLLGEKDTLVPASLDDYLKSLSGVKSHIIAGSAHLPFISHSDTVLQQLEKMMND